MDEKINLTLVKQLKHLFNFSNEQLKIFYEEFNKIDIEDKKKLLVDLDNKIKSNNDFLNWIKTKLKIKSNEIEEYIEKKDVKIGL